MTPRQNTIGYLFAAPWLVGLLGFTLFPIVVSLLLSFCQWSGINLEFYRPGRKVAPDEEGKYIRWVGTANYRRALGGLADGAKEDFRPPRRSASGAGAARADVPPDKNVWTALKNTAYYSFLAVPLGLCVALATAMLLNQQLRGIGLFRTVFYMPHILGGVATIMMWMWVFNPTYGLFNAMLRAAARAPQQLGLLGASWQPPDWLYGQTWSKPALVIMSLWGTGAAMLIFLAALQNVPEQLYEAARVDGAGRWRQFRHVTLPQITPALFFNLVIGIIGSFQVFDTAYIMTGGEGGVNKSLLFYVLYIYQKAFHDFEFGYASALAWVLFAVILAFTLLLVRSSRWWVYYEGERR